VKQGLSHEMLPVCTPNYNDEMITRLSTNVVETSYSTIVFLCSQNFDIGLCRGL